MSLELFSSYAHEDRDAKERLLTHLRPLERQEILTTWEDGRIDLGSPWRGAINEALLLDTINEIPVEQHEYKGPMAKALLGIEALAGSVVTCRQREYQGALDLKRDTLHIEIPHSLNAKL
ncbi:MAG: hypothetical protein KDH88_05140 [Chromatiales bacterium]|nr:hypothetical protein [Chromatiales bacterium]